MDWSRFASLKGEFEAEGLARDDIAAEAIYAAKRGLPYTCKIGGCEAKSDVAFLARLGVDGVVAPMIESAFAMRKYQEMLPSFGFDHIGVTIETITAVERIEAILDAGVRLTNVTIGRSDLTASFDGAGVDSAETIAHVKTVARAARARGLTATMGGGINARTRALLREDAELAGLIEQVETRKVIMPVPYFLEDAALDLAIKIELELLDLRSIPLGKLAQAAGARAGQIRARL